MMRRCAPLVGAKLTGRRARIDGYHGRPTVGRQRCLVSRAPTPDPDSRNGIRMFASKLQVRLPRRITAYFLLFGLMAMVSLSVGWVFVARRQPVLVGRAPPSTGSAARTTALCSATLQHGDAGRSFRHSQKICATERLRLFRHRIARR